MRRPAPAFSPRRSMPAPAEDDKLTAPTG
jgi:hypothetical protein